MLCGESEEPTPIEWELSPGSSALCHGRTLICNVCSSIWIQSSCSFAYYSFFCAKKRKNIEYYTNVNVCFCIRTNANQEAIFEASHSYEPSCGLRCMWLSGRVNLWEGCGFDSCTCSHGHWFINPPTVCWRCVNGYEWISSNCLLQNVSSHTCGWFC